jgi:hypothetical protein
VHGAGPPATGQAEVRAALEIFSTTWNQSRFEPRGLLFGDQHWVVEWTLHATVAGPLVTEVPTTVVTGKLVSFEGVDVVRVSCLSHHWTLHIKSCRERPLERPVRAAQHVSPRKLRNQPVGQLSVDR